MVQHDLLCADTSRRGPSNPLDHRMHQSNARTRKGSSFQLQRYGTRFNKQAVPSRTSVTIGTMDGGLGMVFCLEERMYKRLIMLQQIMVMTVPTPFALNPRDYRQYNDAHLHVRVARKGAFIDGSVLYLFLSLPPKMQDQLAATVGATSYLIKENLHELDYLNRFF